MRCVRCAKSFRHAHRHSLTWSLASALTGLLFYIIVLSAPFIDVLLYGRARSSNIMTGIEGLSDQGMQLLASIVFLFAVALPLVKLTGLAIVLGNLHMRHPPRWTVTLFGHLKRFNMWAMVEIYLLGSLVAYTRLTALVHVRVDTAVFALIGLVLSMVMIDFALDPEEVWEKTHEKGLTEPPRHAAIQRLTGCNICHQANDMGSANCCRCKAPLHIRKPNSLSRTWALTVGAAILYIPANVIPFMQITSLDRTKSYTILRGVQEFIHAGLWPLALLVFIASIIVPLTKLISLGAMLIMTRQKSSVLLLQRTRLYRLIDFIGRWSMIDVFMLSILVGLMQFGKLAKISPDSGALYFAAVVILTMFAVSSFDPRLMWDASDRKNTQRPRSSGHD